MSQNTSDEVPCRSAEAVLVAARRRVLAAPQAHIEVAAVADSARPAEGLRSKRRGEPAAHGQLLDARLEGMGAVGRREASFRLEGDFELTGAVLAVHGPNVDADRGHGLGDGVGEVCFG
jgi:hypothetical protein